MRTRFISLLLLVFFSNTIYSQEEVDTVKAFDFLKKLYSNTTYLGPFFEEEINASKYLNNELTEVNWNKIYTQQDLERMTKEIKDNIDFDIGKEDGITIKQSDSVKVYQYLSVVFSLPEGIDKEFIEVNFEPTKILIANQAVTPYPEDRGTKFNESGFFSHDGEYTQRIPISILKSEQISGKIKVEGVLKIAMASKMVKLELEQNKAVKTIQNKPYELLGIKYGKAYLKGHKTKKESFKDKDYKLCVDEEGMKNCGTMVTIPYRCYDYLSKGLQHFDSIAYSKILESLTYSNFEKEEKVILINSRSDFNKLILFSPENILSAEETINKTTLDFGKEVEVTVRKVRHWKNFAPSQRTVDLTLDVKGLIKRPQNYIKIKEITNALDNTGKVLKHRSLFSEDYKEETSLNKLTISFEPPAEEATSISTVQGILINFHPTIENKGKIQIQDPLSQVNANLLASNHKELQLYLLTYEGHQELLVQKEEEFNRLVQRQKEIEKADFTKESEEKVRQLREDRDRLHSMIYAINSTFEDNSKPKEGTLNFYLHDPEKKLVDIIVYIDDKKNIYRSWSRSNNRMMISFEKKPSSKLLLEVLIENKEDCIEFPFELKQIKLPED